MCCRYDSGNDNIFKFRGFFQTCRHKENKNYFYKFGRLNIYTEQAEAKLCPSGCGGKNRDYKESRSAHACVNISPLIQKCKFSDQYRNNQSEYNSQNNKGHLTDRRAVGAFIIRGKSRNHDHTRCDKHTHIVDNKP